MITRSVAVLVLLTATCNAGKPWEACQFVAYTEPRPFYVSCWGDDGKGLYATFIYNGTLRPIRPKLSLQVSHDWEGPWSTVARVRARSERLQGSSAYRVRVQLESFRPHLSSHACGRVVLDSGDAASITLSKLLGGEERPGQPRQ